MVSSRWQWRWWQRWFAPPELLSQCILCAIYLARSTGNRIQRKIAQNEWKTKGQTKRKWNETNEWNGTSLRPQRWLYLTFGNVAAQAIVIHSMDIFLFGNFFLLFFLFHLLFRRLHLIHRFRVWWNEANVHTTQSEQTASVVIWNVKNMLEYSEQSRESNNNKIE